MKKISKRERGMTPVDQVYRREFGEVGDCWRACVATLLDKPIAEVPHFGLHALARCGDARAYVNGDKRPDGGPLLMDRSDAWDAVTNEWLEKVGLRLHNLTIKPELDGLMDGEEIVKITPFVITCGPSARGCGHCVVADLRKLIDGASWLVHDPHPSRLGIDGIESVVAIVPLDTAV